MLIYQWFIAPFADSEALRRALVGAFALSLGAGPIGIFLMLRRMSLMGDSMSHAILPGVAVGFLVAGDSTWAMTLGGLAAGLVVALLAGLVARTTQLKEDASLAAMFVISLALGIVIISARGGDTEIVHVLFGDIGALDRGRLVLIASATTLTLVGLAVIWRPLVIESVDPQFLRSVSRSGAPAHAILMALVVINLVAAYQAFGTLLAVGLMMLPAIIARFWSRDLTTMVAVAVGSGTLAGYGGLLLAHHAGVAAGPAIILVAGALYFGSVLFGEVGGVLRPLFRRRHLEA